MTTQTNIAQHPAAMPMLRNAIAVASGKGGVGKTWFSISLSHALALAGSRVLLFDGDLGLANVDIQLGLVPKRDVATVVAGRAQLADAVMRFEEGGFDILAGRSGSGSLANLPRQELRHLVQGLAGVAPRYEATVLDLAAGVDQSVSVLAGMAGAAMVVTTDEPTAITDAYALIKTMAAKGQTKGIGVVVNLAANAAEGRRTYATLAKACESFLGFAPPLIGVIRRDRRVPESIRRQTALFTRFPTCDAAEDVQAIAEAWRRDFARPKS